MLLLAVSLLGFFHSSVKHTLSLGLAVSTFVMLHLAMRSLAGAWAIRHDKRKKRIVASEQGSFLYLFALALMVALLQFLECKSLEAKGSVASVTFLVFSYPLPLVFFNWLFFKEKITFKSLIQPLLAITGIALIFFDKYDPAAANIQNLLLPLTASFFMALWFCWIKLCRQKGFLPSQLAFWGDFIAFVFLTVLYLSQSTLRDLFVANLQAVSGWQLLVSLLFTSLLFNWFPNRIYYKESHHRSAVSLALFALLEPLFSGLLSLVYWGETFSSLFVGGALFILIANIPLFSLKKYFQSSKKYLFNN